MSATNARGHLSSETIDLLLLAALSSNEANEAKAHIDACAMCKQRWMELNEDSQKFNQFVFARTLPAVEARLRASKQGVFSRLKLQFLLPALGVATAAVLALTFGMGSGTPTEDSVYIGVKGLEPSFEVFAQRDQAASFAVNPGSSLKPKDRIRFAVRPGDAKYILVASVDSRGTFSVYHPFGATESEKIGAEAPRRIELSTTVELDETIGTEKLLVVLSESPLQAEALKAALAQSPGTLKIDGAKVLTHEFVKVAP
jgi:hypothetical protein